MNSLGKIGKEIGKVVKETMEIFKDLYNIKSIGKKTFDTIIGLLNIMLFILNIILETFNNYWLLIPYLYGLITFLQILGKFKEKQKMNGMVTDLKLIREKLVKTKI